MRTLIFWHGLGCSLLTLGLSTSALAESCTLYNIKTRLDISARYDAMGVNIGTDEAASFKSLYPYSHRVEELKKFAFKSDLLMKGWGFHSLVSALDGLSDNEKADILKAVFPRVVDLDGKTLVHAMHTFRDPKYVGPAALEGARHILRSDTPALLEVFHALPSGSDQVKRDLIKNWAAKISERSWDSSTVEITGPNLTHLLNEIKDSQFRFSAALAGMEAMRRPQGKYLVEVLSALHDVSDERKAYLIETMAPKIRNWNQQSLNQALAQIHDPKFRHVAEQYGLKALQNPPRF